MHHLLASLAVLMDAFFLFFNLHPASIPFTVSCLHELKTLRYATLCILHSAAPETPHFGKHSSQWPLELLAWIAILQDARYTRNPCCM